MELHVAQWVEFIYVDEVASKKFLLDIIKLEIHFTYDILTYPSYYENLTQNH